MSCISSAFWHTIKPEMPFEPVVNFLAVFGWWILIILIINYFDY